MIKFIIASVFFVAMMVAMVLALSNLFANIEFRKRCVAQGGVYSRDSVGDTCTINVNLIKEPIT